MSSEINILMATAATVGIVHTLAGPDHYLPFVVIAKARKWSLARTSLITFLCGLGHVGSSIALGTVGIAFGVVISRIEGIESIRGNLAAYAFVLFGLVYMLWGIYRAVKNKPHKHVHYHAGGMAHDHNHVHENAHDHVHKKEKVINLTPWVLIIIFVLGPCEVLIPMLMYPAAEHGTRGIFLVSAVFAVTTIATMLLVVMLLVTGFNKIPFGKLERYTHAIAGATVMLSGVAILLGL
jgi:ABC-type nickel/cobalt efflux system permease component RcnA